MDEMLAKHQPTEIDGSMVEVLQQKATQVMVQIPKINQLEQMLEIQEEDAELTAVKSSMEKKITETKRKVTEGNKQVRDKVGAIPDGAKVLTEGQYQDQMSFVLKH